MENTEKETPDPLSEAQNLLVSWNLESLCESFQEQEVCIKAFIHLTDADIIELIPKIGPRAIFRSHLVAWREQQGFNEQSYSSPHTKASLQQQEPNIQSPNLSQIQTSLEKDESNVQSPIISHNKTSLEYQESNAHSHTNSHRRIVREQQDPNIQIPMVSNVNNAKDQKKHNIQRPIVTHLQSPQAQNELNIQSPIVSHPDTSQEEQEFNIRNPIVILNCDNPDTTTVSIKQELTDISPSEESQSVNVWETVTKEEPMFEDSDSNRVSLASGQKFEFSEPSENESPISMDVRSVLNNSDDGKNALDYYRMNKCLDMYHRKKAVKAVIIAALDLRMDFSVADFHAMTQQLLQLFPKESYDTFYTPRVGNIRARGMLYNKYVNLTRTLRKEGRLGYRRQWRHRSNLGHKFDME